MITFYSNFINEHQIPFCEEMYKLLNGEFRFVASKPFATDRISLGFKDSTDKFPFVIKSYESDDARKEALRLGRDSDVVIIGDAPDEFIEERLKENKLTFRYYERFFKKGRWRILDPRVFLHQFNLSIKHRKKNLHMLCASAYTAPDCRFIFSYPNKTYKWGYFPPVKEFDDVNLIIDKKKSNSILWVSRLIKLKHPEMPLDVAKRLKKEGYSFSMKMIGIGPIEEKVKRYIKENDLEKEVILLGAMSPELVREHMEESEIFLFTSDKNEGWGAVLNESMNSGCAVVASDAIGSVPYLIKDKENGLKFKSKNKKDLFNKVKWLLDNKKERREIAVKAYKTLVDEWNAKSAAERLLELIDCINNGKDIPFIDGPCSRD